MKKCDFIVSNSILLKPQYREVLYDDLPRRLGKYSIDTRIGKVGMLDILMLTGEEEESFIWQLESEIVEVEGLIESNTNSPIIEEKISELSDLKAILEEIKGLGSITRGVSERKAILNNKVTLSSQPLGDILVAIVHLENEDIVLDRNIQVDGKEITINIGQDIPPDTTATVKYIRQII